MQWYYMRGTNLSKGYFVNVEIQPAPWGGTWLTDKEWVTTIGGCSWCWFLCACVLLQNSSVQPWFNLIQFPSNPLSGHSCPLSFLHPDNFIFYVSPLSFLPLADPAVHSAFHSCNSPSFLCSSLLLPPTPLSSVPSSLCQSALWCGNRWRVLGLVMNPAPLPHSSLYWPITCPYSLTTFSLFFFHPASSLSQSLVFIDKPLFNSFAKSHILASFSH